MPPRSTSAGKSVSSSMPSSPSGRGAAVTSGTHYDHLIKLLLIGDSGIGVGKSCLLLRFCDDSFTPSFITTIGIDFKIRTVEVDGKRIKLQIWDTAGQERFRTITTAYYRGAMGILLVYDVTDERSFNNIKNWIGNTQQFASEGVNKILIGNKCDMSDKRVVDRERGEQLAAEYGLQFIETSAKTNINVDAAFMTLTRDIKARLIDSNGLTTGSNQGKMGGHPVELGSGSEDKSFNSRLNSSCCGGGGGGSNRTKSESISSPVVQRHQSNPEPLPKITIEESN